MPTAHLITGLTINILTLVLGFVLLVTASVYVSDIKYIHTTHSPIYTLAILSLIIGALTIVFTAILTILIIKQHPILTTICSGLLIIVIVLAVICGIFLIATRSNLETRVLNQTITIFNNYSNANNSLSTQNAVDRIQQSFKCCGIRGPTYWENFTSNGTSTPDSCCRDMSMGCGKNILTTNNTIYLDGCAQSLYQYFQNMYTTLVAMNFTLVIIACADCIVTLYLMRYMRKRRDSF